ncbi:MAG: GNAT family N-acetyltransferase [Gemmatimonadetes bacterium]|nr:GNAT family N-acetyltransferase [Gemmatimonadota bacterium]
MRLRAARADDVPVIRALIEGLAEYERLRHECVATDEKLASTLFGAQPAAEVVLAEWEGTPVGFALFFRNYSTFLAAPGTYLEDLFVLPAYRGRGIGRALLGHLAALTVARGGQRLEWSVLDWNEDAIRFYRAQGARPQDQWTVHRVTGQSLLDLAQGAETA